MHKLVCLFLLFAGCVNGRPVPSPQDTVLVPDLSRYLFHFLAPQEPLPHDMCLSEEAFSQSFAARIAESCSAIRTCPEVPFGPLPLSECPNFHCPACVCPSEGDVDVCRDRGGIFLSFTKLTRCLTNQSLLGAVIHLITYFVAGDFADLKLAALLLPAAIGYFFVALWSFISLVSICRKLFRLCIVVTRKLWSLIIFLCKSLLAASQSMIDGFIEAVKSIEPLTPSDSSSEPDTEASSEPGSPVSAPAPSPKASPKPAPESRKVTRKTPTRPEIFNYRLVSEAKSSGQRLPVPTPKGIGAFVCKIEDELITIGHFSFLDGFIEFPLHVLEAIDSYGPAHIYVVTPGRCDKTNLYPYDRFSAGISKVSLNRFTDRVHCSYLPKLQSDLAAKALPRKAPSLDSSCVIHTFNAENWTWSANVAKITKATSLCVHHTCDTVSGDSGSPLISNGAAVAMHLGTVVDSQPTVNYAVLLDYNRNVKPESLSRRDRILQKADEFILKWRDAPNLQSRAALVDDYVEGVDYDFQVEIFARGTEVERFADLAEQGFFGQNVAEGFRTWRDEFDEYYPEAKLVKADPAVPDFQTVQRANLTAIQAIFDSAAKLNTLAQTTKLTPFSENSSSQPSTMPSQEQPSTQPLAPPQKTPLPSQQAPQPPPAQPLAQPVVMPPLELPKPAPQPTVSQESNKISEQKSFKVTTSSQILQEQPTIIPPPLVEGTDTYARILQICQEQYHAVSPPAITYHKQQSTSLSSTPMVGLQEAVKLYLRHFEQKLESPPIQPPQEFVRLAIYLCNMNSDPASRKMLEPPVLMTKGTSPQYPWSSWFHLARKSSWILPPEIRGSLLDSLLSNKFSTKQTSSLPTSTTASNQSIRLLPKEEFLRLVPPSNLSQPTSVTQSGPSSNASLTPSANSKNSDTVSSCPSALPTKLLNESYLVERLSSLESLIRTLMPRSELVSQVTSTSSSCIASDTVTPGLPSSEDSTLKSQERSQMMSGTGMSTSESGSLSLTSSISAPSTTSVLPPPSPKSCDSASLQCLTPSLSSQMEVVTAKVSLDE